MWAGPPPEKKLQSVYLHELRPPMCDCASQHYKRRMSIISSSGADDKACVILVLTRSTRVRIRLLANFFFSLFKFKITSERHLFLIKMKEIIKKLKIKYRIGLG